MFDAPSSTISGRDAGNRRASRKRSSYDSVDARLNWRHEDALRRRGFRRIAGLDEVGRGSLAGPVVAAAVILDRTSRLPGVRDSKVLSEARRGMQFGEIAGGWVVAIHHRQRPQRCEVAAASAIVRGFAVGRTLFASAAQAWLSGQISDETAIEDIAGRFRALVEVWSAARDPRLDRPERSANDG